MATCIVSTSNGQKVAEVRFLSSPPDTEATVFSSSGQAVGSIKSRHTTDEGAVYDAQGNMVGTLYRKAMVDDLPCLALDSAKTLVGGVVSAHQVMAGPGPGRWTSVGAVETESWTAEDDQGLKETMIWAGKGNPGPDYFRIYDHRTRAKQRNLAGVAALLLGLLPPVAAGGPNRTGPEPS